MGDADRNLIKIDAFRLNTKDGELEYQVAWKLVGKRKHEITWEKRDWLVQQGYQEKLVSFEHASAQKGRVRKSPRKARSRTRSPKPPTKTAPTSKTVANTPTKKKSVSALTPTPAKAKGKASGQRGRSRSASKPGSRSRTRSRSISKSAAEKAGDESSSHAFSGLTTYKSLQLPSNFWLNWVGLSVLALLGSSLVKILKASLKPTSKSKHLLDGLQVLTAIPYFLCAYAVRAKGDTTNFSTEYINRAMHSLFWLGMLTLLESTKSVLLSAAPGLEPHVSDFQMLFHSIWIGFLYDASRHFYSETSQQVTIIGLGVDIDMSFFLHVLCFIVLSLFDKLDVDGSKLDFGHYGIIYLSALSLSYSLYKTLSEGAQKGVSLVSKLYFLCAQIITSFFTLLLVLQVLYDREFGLVQHIKLYENQEANVRLTVDTIAVLSTILKWVFAGIVTFSSVKYD